MWKRRKSSNLSLRISLILATVASLACSTTRTSGCSPADARSVLESWVNLRSSTVVSLAPPNVEVSAERQPNLQGVIFTNVQYGSPRLHGCRCCATFTFEGADVESRLVSFVSIKRTTSLKEAVAAAAEYWREFADVPLDVDFGHIASDPSFRVLRQVSVTVAGRRYLGELLLTDEVPEKLFIVRMAFGQANTQEIRMEN